MKKGYLLIEVIISIGLISIIAILLFPIIINSLNQQRHITKKYELIESLKNDMEQITGNYYHNKELKFNTKNKIEIEEIKGNLLLIKISGALNDKGKRIEFKKIFNKKRNVSN